MEFYKTLFGTSRTIALCNIIAAERNLLPVATTQTFGPSINKKESKIEITKPDQTSQENKKCEVPDEKLDSETETSDQNGDVNGAIVKEEPKQEKKPEGESVETVKNASPEELNNDKDTSTKSESESVKPEGMRDPPDVVHVTPSSAAHISSSTTSDAKSGSGGAPRESVWQKLSNKIKVIFFFITFLSKFSNNFVKFQSLERNVTLSSGYLEELSVRYKKQIEDLQLSARQTNEALTLLTEARNKDRQEIDQLKEDLRKLTSTVTNINTTMETAAIWVSEIVCF